MPSARPRAIEDSRSETSSTITSLKERNAPIHFPSAGIPKSKKIASSNLNGSVTAPKHLVNGSATAPADLDPNLPRTDWHTMPISLLHTYRHAHHLATPSAYTHPHADLIYKSSRTALRSPSSVLTRRRLRDLKHQRRKESHHVNGKLKEKEVDRERSSDRLKGQATMNLPAQPLDPAVLPMEMQAHKQPPGALAGAVRRHFNAAQLSEADVLARFLYVVHHGSASQSNVTGLRGGGGDGRGIVMGSHGRAVVRNDGAGGSGELGFRLRFRPEIR